MVDYFEYSPPFGADKGLSEYDILELLDFSPPCKRKYQPLVPGLDPSTRSINYTIEFYEPLDMAEFIFNDKGDGSHPKNPNQSDASHQQELLDRKGSYHATKSLEEDTKAKLKIKSILSLPCSCTSPEMI